MSASHEPQKREKRNNEKVAVNMEGDILGGPKHTPDGLTSLQPEKHLPPGRGLQSLLTETSLQGRGHYSANPHGFTNDTGTDTKDT